MLQPKQAAPADVTPLYGAPIRRPPSNDRAEQALLGTILSNNKAFDRVGAFLRPEHFAEPVHAAIYRAIAVRIPQGGICDPVTLKGHFENSGTLDAVGGISYIAQLLDASMLAINASEYGRVIYEAWKRREMIDLYQSAMDTMFLEDLDEPLDTQVSAVVARLDEISAGSGSDVEFVSLTEAVSDAALHALAAQAAGGAPTGLLTGMEKVDRLLGGGLHDGSFTILGGVEGSGKSALGFQWFIRMARTLRDQIAQGAAPGILVGFSLEMTKREIGWRALSAVCGVPAIDLRNGQFDRHQAHKMQAAETELRGMPLYLTDATGLSPGMMRMRLRQLRRKHGRIRGVLVDHFHITEADAGVASDTAVRLQSISKALKVMAKEENCPVLALAQLGKDVKRREDNRPKSADLRYISTQDCDVVAFVHRQEMFLAKAEPLKKEGESFDSFNKRRIEWEAACVQHAGRAEFLIDKNRFGSGGMVPLTFDGPTTSFREPHYA
ncbi:MAG: DnaB-like helicase C-terminal domain-containing protein [Janthinobacterium lividum]